MLAYIPIRLIVQIAVGEEQVNQRMYFNFKSILSISLAAFLIMMGSAHAAGELNVYNWAEYIGEDTIANFEAEFDVKVTYDNYDSVETVDAKLLAGNSGYDVVSHSSSAVARIMPAGVIKTLDVSKLPNFKHMDKNVMEQIAKSWDPDNNHIIPFMWGTHGVTYNAEMVEKVFPGAPIGSLDLIFKPENMEKLAKCGVAFLDSPTDIVPMALAYLGLDPSSTNRKDYKAVQELLAQIRPYIKTFDNYAYARMPEREFCVAVTWGPDGLFATNAAEEAGTGVVLDFFLPDGEGKANIWVDGWIVPSDAKNVDNAYLFLNYMMRPEVGAADTNLTWYATANATAKADGLIDPDITSAPSIFPSAEEVGKMYPLAALPPKVAKIRTRVWTNFKSGQ